MAGSGSSGCSMQRHNLEARFSTAYQIESLETRTMLSVLLATFAPTLPKMVRPSDNPALPMEFDRFLPPGRTGRADAAAPDVAEWTRTGRPGDTIVITADQLSTFTGTGAGTDTGFVVYGQTRLRQGVLLDAEMRRVDGQVSSIELNGQLPQNSMYFVWPQNADGYGDPVAINRTESWWVGPDRAKPGEIISVFGRNLSHDGGEDLSWVYVKPVGTAAGQWAQVTAVNPYKVDFIVPGELQSGMYEVWVHNGHGGNYGWSAPLTFEVRGGGQWDGTKYDTWKGPTLNVRDYGAKGDGVSDDYAAIKKAMDKAAERPGSTIYFPPGQYRVSDGFRHTPARTRWLGEKGLTVLKPIDGYRRWGVMFDEIGAESELVNLILDASSHGEAQIRTLARTGATHDVRFENVDFYGQKAWIDLDFVGGERITLKNSIVVGRGIHVGTSKQIFLDEVHLYGTRDTDILIWAEGGSEISVSRSTGRDYNNADPTSGAGWAQGRFYAGQGWGTSQSHIYLGNNSTYDLGVRPGVLSQNAGEQFMWELNLTQVTRSPSATSPKTVTLSGLQQLKGDRVTVVGGKGIGQVRRIIDFDPATGTIVVDRPWNVTPDTKSIVSVGFLADKVVVYRNSIDGKVEQVTQAQHTASSGVNMFGASVDFIVDGNRMQEVRHGIYNWMTDDGREHHPFFSNTFVNNTIWHTRQAISVHAAGVGNGATAYLGNIYRDNVVKDALEHGFYMRSIGHGEADANMNVIERNRFSHLPLGMRLDRHRGNLRNTIIQRNHFWQGETSIPNSYGLILFNVKDPLIGDPIADYDVRKPRGNVFGWFQTMVARWGELYLPLPSASPRLSAVSR